MILKIKRILCHLLLIAAFLVIGFHSVDASYVDGSHLKVVSITTNGNKITSGDSIIMDVKIKNYSLNPVRVDSVFFFSDRGELYAATQAGNPLQIDGEMEAIYSFSVSIPIYYEPGEVVIDAYAKGTDLITGRKLDNMYNGIFNGDMTLDENSNGVPDGWDSEYRVNFVERNTSDYVSPPSSLKLHRTETSSASYAWNKVLCPVKPNEPIVIDFFAKNDTSNGRKDFYLRWYDKDKTLIERFSAKELSFAPNSWTQYSVELTPPPNAYFFDTQFYLNTPAVGSLWIDDVVCMMKAETEQKLFLEVVTPVSVLYLEPVLKLEKIVNISEGVENLLKIKYHIKNPSAQLLSDSVITDKFSPFVMDVRGLGKYDAENRTLKIEIGEIEPYDEYEYEIEVCITPSSNEIGNYILISEGAYVTSFFYDDEGEVVIARSTSLPVSTEIFGSKGKIVAKQNPEVEICVYKLNGSLVKNIYSGKQEGNKGYSFFWDGTDNNNNNIKEGIYLLKLISEKGLVKFNNIEVLPAEGRKVELKYTIAVTYDSFGEDNSIYQFKYFPNSDFEESPRVNISNNIFNPKANPLSITYQNAEAEDVSAVVKDLNSKVINVLAKEMGSLDQFSFVWNGKDSYGRDVPPGVYIVYIEARKGIYKWTDSVQIGVKR